MKLQSLRKRSKKLSIMIVAVSIVLIFFLTYYVGNGFSLNDSIFGTNDDFQVWLDHPREGQLFLPGDDIHVDGMVVGGLPSKVYVWDERYNVPVSCAITASRFGIMLFADDLSAGGHILCVQAQSADGRWSPVVKVGIEKQGGTSIQHTWVESNLPEPFATVFRPVEEIVENIVVIVSGGTAPDDLSGDNIQDVFQQSPVIPRYNPMNIPLTTIIVFVIIALVVLMLVFYGILPYMKRRQMMKRELQHSPEQRQWVYRLKQLRQKGYLSKLRAERAKSKRLEKKLMEEQEKRLKVQEEKLKALEKRPVKIYLGEKRKVKR